MTFETGQFAPRNLDCDLIVLWGWKGDERFGAMTCEIDAACQGALSEAASLGGFAGDEGEMVALHSRGTIHAPRILLVGLGPRAKFDAEVMREGAARAIKKADALHAADIAIALPDIEVPSMHAGAVAEAVTVGAALGLYRYRRNSRHPQKEDRIYVERIRILTSQDQVDDVDKGMQAGRIISDAAAFVRTWVNHPSNIATAEALESETRAMSDRQALGFRVLDRERLTQEEMGLLLAVGQGAKQPPRMLVVEHRPDRVSDPAAGPIVLVGKGILFDTGGYSLKPAEGMLGMNGDMAGSAVILGVLRAAAELDLPLHVVGLAPIVENLVGPDSYKPNDVFFAKNGKSVEIRSTDAEGRLILADALCYADSLSPCMVIDVATLTGAKVVALGPRMNALYCNDDSLCESLLQACREAGEPMWRMPLDPAYDRQLKSRVADLTNSGGRPAGSVTAARFLANFIGSWPWAHIDIAGSGTYGDGPEYTPRSYLSKGGTDIPLRTLIEFLRQTSRKNRPAVK